MQYVMIGLLVVVCCLIAGFVDCAIEQRKRDKENKKARGDQ